MLSSKDFDAFNKDLIKKREKTDMLLQKLSLRHITELRVMSRMSNIFPTG
jgi:hypothetical protein